MGKTRLLGKNTPLAGVKMWSIGKVCVISGPRKSGSIKVVQIGKT
jgi:hypothetical protein